MRILTPTGTASRAGIGGRNYAGMGLATVVVFVLVCSVFVPPAQQAMAQTPAARLIDVTISLHSIPLTEAEREPYENIIGYFADGVYEASNGAHKIGKVTIYTGARFSDKADMLWVDNCHPSAHISGRRADHLHVHMCDQFGSTDFLADDNGAQGGGYTLAHEWGHYFYSLYDEYEGDGSRDHILSSPHLGDSPVTPSMMNRQWNARGGHYEWLNFSVAKNNTANTAQHRAYGASGWETLAREVSEDPKDGDRAALPDRLYYDDLPGVAPGTDEDARIDLLGTARSDLNIVWVSGNVTLQIVIDHSGSMGDENKMENAKTAARLLVDLAGEDHATVGVVKFDDEVTVVQPLTLIDGPDTRDRIKSEIDGISYDGWTAIGDAAQKALDDLLAFGAEDTNRAVYLLTDGQSNQGVDPLTVLPAYQSAGIPLFTFGYGSDADGGLLQKMADDTGGRYYFSPTGLAQLIQVFQDAQQLTFPSQGLVTGSRNVQAGQSVSIPINVDSTITKLDFVVVYDQNQGLTAQVSVSEPNGAVQHDLDCVRSGSENLCFLTLDNVTSGAWTLNASATGADTEIRYRVSGSTEDVFAYAAAVSSLTGSTIGYPEPIVLLAVLGRELPIAGAAVNGTMESPDGTTEAILFRDDGVAPDVLADDGLYSAIVDYKQDGAHNITVAFDNSAGTAALTEISLAPSIGPDGKMVPYAPPIPVTDNFERFTRIQVNVVNTQPDDHGNTPQDATVLAPTNTDLPGKIDYQGDVDVFRIDVVAPGDLSIRVSNLALGMDPKLRLIAADMTTVLGEADLSSAASSRGYLNLIHSMPAAGTVYAEVSHRSGGTGGFYDVSAGALIAGDGVTTPPTPAPPPPTPTPTAPPAPPPSTPEYVVPRGPGTQTDVGLVVVLIIGLLLVAGVVAILVVVLRQRSGGPAGRAGVSISGAPHRTAGFRRGVLRIGRDPASEMPLSDSRVSRAHARIVQTAQGYVIEDMGSTNGTMVNGEKITRQYLHPNDQIQVGDTVLIFWQR